MIAESQSQGYNRKVRTTISLEPGLKDQLDALVAARGPHAKLTDLIEEACRAYVEGDALAKTEATAAPLVAQSAREEMIAVGERIVAQVREIVEGVDQSMLREDIMTVAYMHGEEIAQAYGNPAVAKRMYQRARARARRDTGRGADQDTTPVTTAALPTVAGVVGADETPALRPLLRRVIATAMAWLILVVFVGMSVVVGRVAILLAWPAGPTPLTIPLALAVAGMLSLAFYRVVWVRAYPRSYR